jgi:hypothetical protein
MKHRIPTGFGLSSLLVIFGVLCLCVFVMLSLSTAQTQERLSLEAQAAVTDFYEADSRAQEILAQLRSGQIPQGVTEEGGVYRYSCPISQNRTLTVAVRIRGTDYEILQWQTVSTGRWQPEEDLPVWQGG